MKLKKDSRWLLKEIEAKAAWRFKFSYEQVPKLGKHFDLTYQEEDEKIEEAFSKVKETKEWKKFRKLTIDGYVKKLSINLFDELTDRGNKDLIQDLAKKL